MAPITVVEPDNSLLEPADRSIQYHDLDPIRKEAEQGAPPVGMDSTGGESSTRKETEEAVGKRPDMVEETWQIERRTALLGIKKNFAEEAALPAGMCSMGGESSMRKQAEEESGKGSEMRRQAEEDMDEVGRGKLAIEEHLPMVDFEVKSEMETEDGKADEAAVDMNSDGVASFIQEEAENKLGKRLQRMGIRTEMQLCAEEDYSSDGIQRALLDIKERFAKKKNGNPDKEALRQLVKDFSDNFDISMKSTSTIQEHTPVVDKLLIEAADPSATDSVTRLGQCSAQDDLDHERGISATQLTKKTADEEMADEAKMFDLYRAGWESAWSKTCGFFEYMTLLSSMQFTYYTPGRPPHSCVASTPATLQILSIKLSEVAGGLQWPLSVYGVVAVRDAVDHNRNILFSCDRNNSQELTQNDPFLRLIGPSRAVVYTDMVNFEVQLKVKGTTEFQDKALITKARNYNEAFDDASIVCFKNCFCTIELRVQVVEKTTQATILGVQVARCEPSPFEYGARVACSSLPGKWEFFGNRVTCVTSPASGEIVMVDSKDGAMLKGVRGYLHLPRTVISVESEGMLDVEIQAYSKSGEIAAKELVRFPPEFSKISPKKCYIRGVMVVITVAWSCVAEDKHDVMALGCLV